MAYRVLEQDRFAALELAESRLEAHARERSAWRRRRARLRAVRAWVLALLVVPVAGAVGFVAVLEAGDGDLGGWPAAAAAAFTLAPFAGPPALAGTVSRGFGRRDALGLALCTGVIEVGLVFGIAFVVLGFGPR